METKEETIIRKYIVTQKEFQERLALNGTIATIELFSGLSPNDEEKGVSPDKITWEIKTYEIKKKKV